MIRNLVFDMGRVLMKYDPAFYPVSVNKASDKIRVRHKSQYLFPKKDCKKGGQGKYKDNDQYDRYPFFYNLFIIHLKIMP